MSTHKESTPVRKHSSQTHTESAPPLTRLPEELVDLIGVELQNQTYQFESDTVARMLSPKRLQKGLSQSSQPSQLSLARFECLIDQEDVKTAMVMEMAKLDLRPLQQHSGWNTGSETRNYVPLVNFLNQCVEICGKIYDSIKLPESGSFTIAPRAQRWFPNLRFMVYDRSTKDGVNKASPLKPDFVGVNDMDTQSEKEVKCWWGLPSSEHDDVVQGKRRKTHRNLQIKLAGEVKDNWPELVRQSGTYARALFSACPLRGFCLAIAFNYVKREIRYLIFHPGGLTASEALNLASPGDCHGIIKILLSILLWQSPTDAGLPPFTDGHHFCLPTSTPLPRKFEIVFNIHQRLSVRGRHTYVLRLRQQRTATAELQSAHTLPGPFEHSSNKRRREDSDNPEIVAVHTSPGMSEHSSNKRHEEDSDTSDHPIHPREEPRELTAVQWEGIPPGLLGVSATESFVVKCSWPNFKKEKNEPDMYMACAGAFGAPKFLSSFVACYSEGHPMCNSILLPPPEEDLKKYYWDIFSKPCPDEADCRTLWIAVLTSEGQTLEGCANASDLSNCLLHSMLGWLTALLKGYLHRDISIGNLLKLFNPAPCESFSALKGCNDLLQQLKQLDQLGYSTLEACNDLRQLAERLDSALKEFQLTNECKAIFIDGDMSAYMPKYFDKTTVHDKGSLSGTREFMSARLLKATDWNTSIFQSPLDDLWSFFWTALWATLFNCHDQGTSDFEKMGRRDIRSESEMRDMVVAGIRTIPMSKDYSTILQKMAPLLREWSMSLEKTTFDYNNDFEQADGDPINLLNLFYKVALKGVLNFVVILSESRLLIN